MFWHSNVFDIFSAECFICPVLLIPHTDKEADTHFHFRELTRSCSRPQPFSSFFSEQLAALPDAHNRLSDAGRWRSSRLHINLYCNCS